MTVEALEAALGRFVAKVEVCPVTGCWHWRGATSRGGQRGRGQSTYGSFWVCRGLILRVHVYVAWLFGLIDGRRVPPGMELDHECENSLCVCPFHLALVPAGVNQDYRHGRRTRRRPTWRDRYTYRGLGPGDAVAVEPRHLRGDDRC